MRPVDEAELRSFLYEHELAWITAQEAELRVIALPLTSDLDARLAPFFGEALADARISSVPVSNPPWYGDLRARGVDQRDLLDFGNLVAITFNTTVNLLPDGPEPTMALLFHEFVHVLQYRLLGVQEFTRRYVDGWLAGGAFIDRPDLRYVSIPLERQAYDLQARFAAAPNSAFSVEAALQQETASA